MALTLISQNSTSSNKFFWDHRAMDSGTPSELITHRDQNQRKLEIDIILQYLPTDRYILDVGCGNGFSTSILSKFAKHITAIDYSEPMIERAKRDFGHIANVDFQVGTVLDLKFPTHYFDVVISQRCLINLSTWEDQQQALLNIAKVLRPSGFLFLQEGSFQGRNRLNQVRDLMGLSLMPPVEFNLDFDEELLWPFLKRYFEVIDIRRSGLYDLISRVVHPLLVRPAEPAYNSKINEVASLVSSRLRGMEELSREFTAFLRCLKE